MFAMFAEVVPLPYGDGWVEFGILGERCGRRAS